MKKIAIITGASSGLGAEYARYLDKEGLSELWLVARRREKLEALAAEMGSSCRCLSLDLAAADSLDRFGAMLAEDSGSLQIAYLVNARIRFPHPHAADERPGKTDPPESLR